MSTPLQRFGRTNKDHKNGTNDRTDPTWQISAKAQDLTYVGHGVTYGIIRRLSRLRL